MTIGCLSDTFDQLIAPVAVLLIFGYMGHRVGSLNYWLQFEERTVISIALLRGFAEMSLGCLCYLASRKLCGKLENKYRYLSSVFELLCLSGILYTIYVLGSTKMDFFAALLMAGIITSFFIGNSLLSKLLNNRVCGYLGKVSISI